MPIAFLCCLSLLSAGTGPDDCPSYLIRCDVGTSCCEPYVPRAGDLVFFDKPSRIWDLMDVIARTRPPDHLGIVVAMPDGSTAILEAGPDAQPHVYLMDAASRIAGFRGRVYVRRSRCPLSPEQSDALTDFAIRQVGKRYSLLRLARQITPFRTRGPVRTRLFAATIMERKRWICSDLVITAGTAAGLFDPRRLPASAIYAHDVVHDHIYDLSCLYEPVARWSRCPIDADAAPSFVRPRPMFTR